jgi:leucyl-tRNA synthetase
MDSEWSDSGIVGIYRFLSKSWNLIQDFNLGNDFADEESLAVTQARHRLIHDVTDRMEHFKFNTAVSAFMEFINGLSQIREGVTRNTMRDFIILISPFAPHFACQLWEYLQFPDLVFNQQWPLHDDRFLQKDEIEIGVQVKGKLRGSIHIPPDASEEEVVAMALANEGIKKHVGEGPLRKVIYVKGRILNLIN